MLDPITCEIPLTRTYIDVPFLSIVTQMIESLLLGILREFIIGEAAMGVSCEIGNWQNVAP